MCICMQDFVKRSSPMKSNFSLTFLSTASLKDLEGEIVSCVWHANAGLLLKI